MSYAQYLEELDYSNSARYDRFDGFDVGDRNRDDEADDIARWEAVLTCHEPRCFDRPGA